jgi:enediyne biosynthesis protein E4
VSGIDKAYGAGLGVAAGDYNGDGWPDLYVANDGTPNQLWINQKNGTFVDDGLLSGSALNAGGNPEGSMGIASGDFDQDGDEDLFVTNIVSETSVLYVNDGHGTFEDARARSGLAALTAAFTGFGTDWIDYDNDGWPDLFVANGAVNIVESQRGQPTPFRMKNQLFHNLEGRRFEETSASAGPAFAVAEIGRGAAFGDIDNDGDTDVVVGVAAGRLRLLVNNVGNKNGWLGLRLMGGTTSRDLIGARVEVSRAGQPALWRRARSDGSYASANDPRVLVGLGRTTAAPRLRVVWPDGRREEWPSLPLNSYTTLKEGSSATGGAAK